MAELQFFTGTMDSGKSTLALQTNHNHAARGRIGRMFTTHDRAGDALISSRLGLTHDAIEVDEGFDFWTYVVRDLTHGARIDYLICDEAQFYTGVQIEQLAKIVDELQIDVFAFGILSDFRTQLFEGSQRLVELADRMNVLQVEALCWCGKRATHNARTVNGEMVTEGEVIVVGDVEDQRGTRRGRLRGPLPRPPPPQDDRRPGPGHLDDRRAAAVRVRPDVGIRTLAQHGESRPASGTRQPYPTRIGMCISRGVSEPCRPIRVISYVKSTELIRAQLSWAATTTSPRRRRTRESTSPNQPRRIASSRVSTVARSPSTPRQVAATSSTAPPRQ